MSVRDYQRQRVYDWENKVFSARDKSVVQNLSHAQVLVIYVWEMLGLTYPPVVTRLSARNKKAAADATRLEIRIRESGVPTWVMLHEIAHSLTTDAEGRNATHHGPRYVGVYIDLLHRFMGWDKDELIQSAREHGVDVSFEGIVI